MKLLLCFYLLASSAFAGPDSDDWTKITNRAFSFSVPSNIEKKEVEGIDSFVGRYAGEGIVISFDYGFYSDDLSAWGIDFGAKLESVTVDGKKAKIATIPLENSADAHYQTAIHVPLKGSLSLTMDAVCRSEKEVALARKIFLTLVFKDEEPNQPPQTTPVSAPR